MNPPTPPILVLEDDPDIGALIARTLAEYAFHSETLPTGKAFLARALQTSPDLCIIDLGLPDMDGLQVLRELQRIAPCAVMILTGRNHLTDRVEGLELGADDYLTKPFEPRELVARVRSILRRYQRTIAPLETPAQPVPTVARFGNWTFDPSRHSLIARDGREQGLSAAEAALLTTLLRHPRRILTREELVGEREGAAFDRSIDVRISRLRRKLDDDPQDPRLIKTVYGAGYLFAASVSWD
ncbi:MAG: response regulator transcription factor [Rhodocyclaceae bacterium]|jgi:DNA-binding response OmpR family regulator|nr:response regulator transcription factor [Rhodocyclaceae bacterium]